LVWKHPSCTIVQKEFEESDLDSKELIILATDNRELHIRIKEMAAQRKILVNVADTPDLCDFYLGSIVQKGSLKIAISTNGKSPTAAKRIKEVLHDALPGELDEVIDNLQKVRNRLNGNFEAKVKKLNSITKVLVEKDTTDSARRWRKIATFSLLIFASMLIGHFILSYLPLQQMTDDTVAWYKTLDKNFHWMVLAGFLAQMVDGATSMGYGVTSSIVLQTAQVSPAAISAGIHTAEMFTSGASGYSHYKRMTKIVVSYLFSRLNFAPKQTIVICSPKVMSDLLKKRGKSTGDMRITGIFLLQTSSKPFLPNSGKTDFISQKNQLIMPHSTCHPK